MSAAIVCLDNYRSERFRAAYIQQLADELEAMADTREGTLYMAGYYEAMGWADASDIQAALKLLAGYLLTAYRWNLTFRADPDDIAQALLMLVDDEVTAKNLRQALADGALK